MEVATLTQDKGDQEHESDATSYYMYFAPPGRIQIAIYHTGKRLVNFDVKAGETYYVRGGTVLMGFGIPYIEIATATEALRELSECKLSPGTVTP